MAEFHRISVIGLGYIGLSTATKLAQCGKQVYGVDTNPEIIAQVNQGLAHFIEPELNCALQQAVEKGLLFASEKPQQADVFLIAVPTPLQENHQPDLSYIKSAVHSIAPYLAKGNLVILESTSPVGTTAQLEQWLKQLRPDLHFPSEYGEQADIQIAYCPERVLPGNVMQELVENDRVIGGLSPKCTQQAVNFYQLFVTGKCFATDAQTAELCKLTENSFRDVNIAFANELSMICDQLNINVWELIQLANRHPRVNILQPSAGVGGHCIAVDPWFIVSQAPEQSHLIRTAREVNNRKPFWVINKIKSTFADCVMASNQIASEVKIACFGLAFKADVSDLRESPALQIVEAITDWHSGELLIVEPNIQQLPASLVGKAMLVSFEQALAEADMLVLLVDHQLFKAYPAEQILQQWIVDTRGIWRS